MCLKFGERLWEKSGDKFTDRVDRFSHFTGEFFKL